MRAWQRDQVDPQAWLDRYVSMHRQSEAAAVADMHHWQVEVFAQQRAEETIGLPVDKAIVRARHRP